MTDATTTKYNELAKYFGMKTVRRLRNSKTQTAKQRLKELQNKYDAEMKEEEFLDGPLNPNYKAPELTIQKKINKMISTLDQLEAAIPPGKPIEKVNGIKAIRPGTALHTFAELVLKGGTIAQLSTAFPQWSPNSIRAGINWDLKRKGYEIEITDTDEGKFYRIANSDYIV